ncbi:MAG: flagellar basal body-associated FliL family protein [Rhodocyclales bacterium]|nr:flagellar basal body-associated FliL family protein [Rhodocyclales bacterium]
MADAKKPEVEAVAAPPKKKGKWILFVIIGIVGLSLGGGAAFFLLKKKAPPEGEDATEGATREIVKKKKADNGAPPTFYKFDKAFTVKLQTEQQEAYLQTEVQMKLQDSHGPDLVKQYEPELKHRITLVLMGKKASELGTAAGVQRLANELRDVTNQVITPQAAQKTKPAGEAGPADTAEPDAMVQSVLFSTFIIQ